MIINQGELGWRINQNLHRITEPFYAVPSVFRPAEYEWHGDLEGRTLLALVSLWNATGERPVTLDALVEGLSVHVNRYGYFGPVFDGKTVHEQQLSGNSWYLRGLTEYYKLTREPRIGEWLQDIQKYYLEPLLPFFQQYPTERITADEGGVFGNLVGEMNGWKLSTDTGCAFISLDGITAVYEITRDATLKSLIDVMIGRFLQMDKAALKCQTHASLSAARGILRMYECTCERTYLQTAEREFAFYAEHGMTLTYANFNWYGRRDTWTEPCAIVDSLILALKLSEHTGKDAYLKMAYRIYYNALRMSQRSNGGAGCDLCAREEFPYAQVFESTYEAYLCCSLRLSEGLLALSNGFVRETPEAVYIRFYDDYEYRSDAARFRMGGDLFFGKTISLEGISCGDKRLYLYLPEYVRVTEASGCSAERYGDWALIHPCAEKTVLRVEIGVRHEAKRIFYGDLLLTEPSDNFSQLCGYDPSLVTITENGRKLYNLPDFSRLPQDVALKTKCRIPLTD